jgi:alpha-D-ribose 1-methylphosphonate 5-triphosphate synthase subunit PhnH
MHRETVYDHVVHSQRHFRAILDSLSRPGTINELEPVACEPPARLSRASALVAMALLNADVSFHLLGMPGEDTTYLSVNTGSRPAPMEEATFIFADGAQPPQALEGVNCGTLAYPDTSSTLVIQVDALSSAPIAGGLKVMLEGPGIQEQASVYTRALNPDLLLALQARNVEFPLGIDAIVTCTGDRGRSQVLGIPRTATVSWELC